MKFTDKLELSLFNISWMPKFKVRESNKAKYLRLVAGNYKTLEIIIPKRRPSVSKIITFLVLKQRWITSNVTLQSEPRHNLVTDTRVYSLNLLLIDELWQLIYINESAVKITANYKYKYLLISGYQSHPEVTKEKIRSWLKLYAKKSLASLIESRAITMGLTYNKLSIRGQKTIWGSCNESGNISLNYKLLFLEKNICDYILVHELCHLKYLDHSVRFWKMVEHYLPNYKDFIASLKNNYTTSML
ncbi:MAG: DUF45 domain-containing protein [Francisellaceae bacterium]|mgnify:CR=1 FL=1|jgi:predicted metal-dependent hydrolase|nr:DUF45 domain-containing protein [Francisellaceae bacterium]MBT6207812.1 DUF45 domain-containing protein [Francisellaceae bacterium]